MKLIDISNEKLTEGAKLLPNHQLLLKKQGAGLDLTWIKDRPERYLYFVLTAHTENSIAFEFEVYSSREPGVIFDMRTGVLGNVSTAICLDLQWMEGNVLFAESAPGQLKITCHGRRVDPEEITKILLTTLPYDEDITVTLEDLALLDEYPADKIFPDGHHLPDVKLVDELGQNKRKSWSSKLPDKDAMIAMLQAQQQESEGSYPYDDWSRYGGWKNLPLKEGTGFFSKIKKDGRWWLTDPEGYAFFSVGPDCVGARSDCRVDGVEKWLDWLPSVDDPEFADMFGTGTKGHITGDLRRDVKVFSYTQANLYRAFGAGWHDTWARMITGQLRKYGMNTLGNWSDDRLFGVTNIPYVTSLPEFPETEVKIFRDFPDVLSDEYAENATRCAAVLATRSEDPWMIGYFLRNEPTWAFVDHLILADEVLYTDQPSVCRERLIADLVEKYQTIEALNCAWNTDFADFSDLNRSQKAISSRSPEAMADMRAFSVKMLDAYIRIPSEACRKVDPNHMILGMRWAWISDPDVITGWQNFDVFSINCYAADPTPAIQNAVDLGVDLPIMIGEFHHGALDAGPGSTGLEGVADQTERGKAFAYYVEHTAAHPYGVGCHYFQCYDQFTLGRFDGENYNIGLFDICSQPYPEMMRYVKATSARMYPIASGDLAPTDERARETSMIAF